MRKILITGVLLTLTILIARAQGIQFEKGLNWQQVLAKAKSEHKYIFVDCYATWCGPCKFMEQTIYSLKEVGDTYNKDFISIKLQMDQTGKDNDTVKSRYRTAKKIETNYAVGAYPTFLFFDPDGEVVHKAAGALNIQQFIQLAADAQNPDKQYYRILKNFQAGKLDTADERGLALAFVNTDKPLAAKIAADYLERIPSAALQNHENGRLMVTLQDDPQVMAIATKFVKSMNAATFAHDADFIAALSNNSAIKGIALADIGRLSQKEIDTEDNLHLLENFADDAGVKQVADRYIDDIPATKLNSVATIGFIERFTQNTSDEGFLIFEAHTASIDTVEKSPFYAQSVIQRAITRTYLKPTIDSAKINGAVPDFEGIQKAITRKYGALYARLCVTDGQVDYFGFLVRKKHQGEYWSQLLSAEATQINLLWSPNPKQSGIPSFRINNTAYDDFFFHEDDPSVMEMAASWLKTITQEEPANFDALDTYACLLYKAEKLNGQDSSDAIELEEAALENANRLNQKHNIELLGATLVEMKQGGPIWESKARLDDDGQGN